METSVDHFWYFLNKLKERLIIVTEYNVANKIELMEMDEDVLFDLFIIHEDNDLLNTLKRGDGVGDTSSQGILFSTDKES
jgi:CTP:phosphocholine cytidylyltransferase-like protein